MTNEEAVKAYNEGYRQGCRDTELKFVESTQVLSEKIKDVTEKHWEECRQIALYDDELKEMKRIINQP